MTTQQMRLAVETAGLGSISAAAEKLGVSQPNASLSLKKLEEELGYPIFSRSSGGITPTDRGYRFLTHAEAMLREEEAIRAIGSSERSPRLRVGVMNYTPAVKAFLRFVSEYGSVPGGDLACLNVSPEEGAKLLRERALDIVVSLQLKATLPLAEQVCRENRFVMTRYKPVPISVRVRKGHPFLQNGMPDGSPKSFAPLANYPYADFYRLDKILPVFNQTVPVPFGCTHIIYTDERDTRLKLVASTDAYSMGRHLSKRQEEKFGLVSIPVDTDPAVPVTFIRKGDEQLPCIRRYTELLTECSPE